MWASGMLERVTMVATKPTQPSKGVAVVAPNHSLKTARRVAPAAANWLTKSTLNKPAGRLSELRSPAPNIWFVNHCYITRQSDCRCKTELNSVGFPPEPLNTLSRRRHRRPCRRPRDVTRPGAGPPAGA
jgi:hypothetical protein